MATVVSSVSGNNVTFTVHLDSGDPLDWGVYISSTADYGLGMAGRGGDTPYYVEEYHGTGNQTFARSYSKAGNYAGELALRGIGVVDYTLFTISAPTTANLYVMHWSAIGLGKIDVWRDGNYYDTIQGNGPEKTLTFNVGDRIKYQATPASGWVYDTTCASGNGCDSSNPFESTITAAMEVTFMSNFGMPATTSAQVTTTVTGSGTVHVDGAGQSADVTGSKMITFPKNATVTWTATPAAGWVFDHWVGPGGISYATNPLSLTINADGTISAVFVQAPVSAVMTIGADRTTINSGDTVNVSGTYKPNTPVNIFIEGIGRVHLGQVSTNSQGNYSAQITLTNAGTTITSYKIGACNASSVPGWPYECALLPDTAFVNINVNPAPAGAVVGVMTIRADKTSINSGDTVTISGTYHPNAPVNIFLEGAVRQHLAQTVTDAQGNYSAKVTITNTGAAEAAYKIGACNVSSVPGWPYECALLPDTAFVNINVMPEGCWIREPVTGTCILTARTGTILAAVGAVALIGIIFLVTRPGTQRFVTELGREVARGATMAVV